MLNSHDNSIATKLARFRFKMDKNCDINTRWRVDFLKSATLTTEVTSDAGCAIPKHVLIAHCRVWNETTCPSTACHNENMHGSKQ
jgi:hypothetical protein